MIQIDDCCLDKNQCSDKDNNLYKCDKTDNEGEDNDEIENNSGDISLRYVAISF